MLFRSQAIFAENHRSFAGNPTAKAALGPEVAEWLVEGAIEWIHPALPPPSIVEPVGAVPKGLNGFRLITDARESNKDVGVMHTRCNTIADASAALDPAAFVSTEDVKRAYHAGALPGCASTLSTHWGYHLQPDGRLVWSPVLQLGCTSRTCLGTCDKARSGMCLDGSLFRFNCAHFGQKLAGVPLFRLMEAFARLCIGHVARRGLPALSKARRHGRPPDPSQPCPDEIGRAHV